MTRNENDLHEALDDLGRRADEHGAPSTADILAQAHDVRRGRNEVEDHRRFPRWVPPLAAAAVVAAAAVTAVTLSNSGSSPSPQHHQALGSPTGAHNSHSAHTAHSATNGSGTATTAPPTHVTSSASPASKAAAVLDDAADQLQNASWTAPSPREFYYVHTNQATSWTSVSGTRAGKAFDNKGGKIYNGACHHGHFIDGMSGTCTVNDVPHYLADAPTDPSAWDAYLEHMAPGSKAAHAQGKIIVQVLHQDLTAPKAAAALLRYTESCPGLHTVVTEPVAGEQLTGVTCTSMTNGSYGLAFDTSSHKFVGFVPVDYKSGRQNYQAEIILGAGVVRAIGDKP